MLAAPMQVSWPSKHKRRVPNEHRRWPYPRFLVARLDVPGAHEVAAAGNLPSLTPGETLRAVRHDARLRQADRRADWLVSFDRGGQAPLTASEVAR